MKRQKTQQQQQQDEGSRGVVEAARQRLESVVLEFPWWGLSIGRVAQTFMDAPGRHLSLQQQTEMLERTYPELRNNITGRFQASSAPGRDRHFLYPALPFETRVTLPRELDLDLGLGYAYVNANWVGFQQAADRRYIGTQAPLGHVVADTRADFWLMVFANRCKSVLMLTPFVENGITKAEPYFPAEVGAEPQTYYSYSATDLQAALASGVQPPASRWRIKVVVMCVSEVDENLLLADEWVRRRQLHLTLYGAGDRPLGAHHLLHFHYTAWPDGSIPRDAGAIVALARRPELQGEPNQPVVVHCSAGHGRTGTMLSLLLALHDRMRTQQESIAEHYLRAFLATRNSRWYSVANVVQLLFGLECFAMWLRDLHGLELDTRQITQAIGGSSSSAPSPPPPAVRCVQCYVGESRVVCAHPHVTGDNGLLPFCSESCSEAFCSI